MHLQHDSRKFFTIILTLLLVLFFLFIKTQQVNTEKTSNVTQKIQQIGEIQDHIVTELMRNRYDNISHYDDLSEMMRVLKSQLKMLMDDGELQIYHQGNSRLDIQLEEYMHSLQVEERQIDLFRRNNALLHNSLRFLPVAVDELSNQNLEQTLINDIHRMLIDLFTYNNELSETSKAQLLQSKAQLFKAQVQYPELKNIMMHVVIAEKSLQYVSATMNEMNKIRELPLLQTIQKEVADDYEAQVQRSNSYRIILFLLTLALLVYTILFFVRLRKVAEKLNATVKELENQKFALDQHSIVGITDTKGDIIYANDMFCEISQYSRKEIFGKNHRILKSDEHSSQFFKQMWATISSGKVWKGEVKNRKKSGEFYWVDTTIVPFVDHTGKPYQYVAIRTDITPRKIYEQELEEATHLAMASNQAKSEFLANMSHEIRTPMNGIMGMTELLLETEVTEEQRKLLNVVASSADSLLGIVNDILNFSKIEAGKLELDLVPFHFESAIGDIIELLRTSAYKKGLELISIAPQIHGLEIVGDSLRLRQVLINLIGNAIKFTERGKVILKVEQLPATIEGKVGFSFIVEDTGIGITAEQQKKIFKAFEQADTSSTRLFGGTGLGLAICEQLVHLMGGKIHLESKYGQGSRFSFSVLFDLVTDETELKHRPIPHASNPPVSDEEKNKQRSKQLHAFKYRILIVEDNKVNQMVMQSKMQSLGHHVMIANDGVEALDILSDEKFDLILMDIQMPNMDGYEATRRIREKEKVTGEYICIIAVTAHAREEDRRMSLAAGMNAHVTKPVDFDSLVETMEQHAAWNLLNGIEK
ncbi:MAG: response regulator [Zetaproteobacteria bacterium]|nr:response regulator [Zetaproteobacteria bacterium]